MAIAPDPLSIATPAITAEAPSTAFRSSPPSRPQSIRIGTPAAWSIAIGTSRAASLPKTISASDRSVVSRCSRLPLALSWQIAPAVVAGATRAIRASWQSIVAM